MFELSKKTRFYVNILGIPLIIFSIFYSFFFPLLIAIILYFCSIEYAEIVNRIGGSINRWLLLILNAFILMNSIYSFSYLLAILTLFFIFLFLNEIIFSKDPNPINCAYYFIGVFWIGYALSASLCEIRNLEYGIFFTLMLFVGVWVCDTAAYIMGSKFGKRKILEKISPNKTYMGCISGLLGSIIVVFSFYHYHQTYIIDFSLNVIDICIISMIIGFIGQIGDFAESLFKRKANIKDTSNILMGHGGFLDRFDSISFSAPIFYMYIQYLVI